MIASFGQQIKWILTLLKWLSFESNCKHWRRKVLDSSLLSAQQIQQNGQFAPLAQSANVLLCSFDCSQILGTLEPEPSGQSFRLNRSHPKAQVYQMLMSKSRARLHPSTWTKRRKRCCLSWRGPGRWKNSFYYVKFAQLYARVCFDFATYHIWKTDPFFKLWILRILNAHVACWPLYGQSGQDGSKCPAGGEFCFSITNFRKQSRNWGRNLQINSRVLTHQ